MRKYLAGAAAVAAVSGAALAGVVNAAPSGAAFTTNADGTVVNQNLYEAPEDVYLNGGPNCGTPRHAAALPDGDYVFRVTTTNGKKLLSTQSIAEREFSVEDGVVVDSTASMLPQACGEGMTVQVGPFDESANGVYKLWIAPAKYGESFPTKASKTDNFKVDPDGFDAPPPDDDPPVGEL